MVSLAEILKEECFRGATLLTEAELTAPSIGSVTVGEVPDIAQWLTGGEMVLSALFTAQADGEEKFETVRNIITGRAAALVVKLGRFVESLPPDIIALANERRFPVVTLPPNVRWTNVIACVSRLLSEHELSKLVWLESVRQQFGRAATGDGNLTSVAQTLREMIGRNVIIEDLTGDVLAHSFEASIPDGYMAVSAPDKKRDQTAKYEIDRKTSHNAHRYHIVYPWKSPVIDRLVFELDDGRGRCGALSVIFDSSAGATDVDERELLAIEKAVEAANIEMSRIRASVDAETRLMGGLFALLGSGNLTLQEAVRRASFLQIDLTRGFVVCAVELSPAHDITDPRAREQVIERAFRLTKRIALAHFPGSLLTVDGDRVNMLLVPPPGMSPSRRRTLVDWTLQQMAGGLSEEVQSLSFRIGASSFHEDASAVGKAHSEAMTAAMISSVMGKEGGIGNFRELGLYKLLLTVNGSHPEEAERFYLEALGSVEEYDRKREGDLVRTLEVFFATRESINETAAKLFTHRHTVRYRLQRIADLCGLDPLNPDNREVLRVAIKLRQLIKATSEIQ